MALLHSFEDPAHGFLVFSLHLDNEALLAGGTVCYGGEGAVRYVNEFAGEGSNLSPQLGLLNRPGTRFLVFAIGRSRYQADANMVEDGHQNNDDTVAL
ncbi:MAG: hypothetical protein JOZ19_11600 [Rubrobacter sp.]|nr:hypothetical protein [Rubrobacter sp.]